MGDTDILETVGVLAAVLLVGVLVAVVLANTVTRRSERRHQKVSKSRRSRGTEYDLVARSETPNSKTPRE
jgi:beta-lactamase regulating signal transducer with metallopeptidase domain